MSRYFNVLSENGPRIRHGKHGKAWLAGTRRAAGRRKVLAGYPVPARAFSDEEIARYLGGDRIECLLCGKSYRRLGGHLQPIHGITEDEYRFRYGLPLSAGLVCVESAGLYANAALARGQDGDYLAAIRKLRKSTGHARPSVVKARRARKNGLVASGRTSHVTESDVRAAIALMYKRSIPFTDAVAAVGFGTSTAYEILRDNAVLRAAKEAAHEALPFAIQARSEQLGERFAARVEALRCEGCSDHVIAKMTGVSAMAVNRFRHKRGIK